MKEKPIEVYAFPRRKSYYFKHPHLFFKDVKIAAKNLWHRARYGYAWGDLWNMDSYLDKLIPNMLRMLAEKSCGVPSAFEAESGEYEEYLRALATLFELAQVDWYEETENEEIIKKLENRKYPKVQALYDEARAFMKDDWHMDLIEFVYKKLGEANAQGWLWD